MTARIAVINNDMAFLSLMRDLLQQVLGSITGTSSEVR